MADKTLEKTAEKAGLGRESGQHSEAATLTFPCPPAEIVDEIRLAAYSATLSHTKTGIMAEVLPPEGCEMARGTHRQFTRFIRLRLNLGTDGG